MIPARPLLREDSDGIRTWGPYLEPQLAVELFREGALEHDDDGHQEGQSNHHQAEAPKGAALPALREVAAAGLQAMNALHVSGMLT